MKEQIGAPPRAATAACLATLLWVGCATPAPPPPPLPAADPPESWTAAPPAGEPAAAVAPTRTDRWWTTFGQPGLDRVVEEALSANRDLAAAAARVEAAVARARIAGADLRPQVGLGADAGRSRRNFIGLPIPGGGDVLSTSSTSIGASLNLSWEADLWGRLRAREAGAAAAAEAVAVDLAGARLSLAGQTAKAWFALQEAELQVRLAEETLANRELSRDRIRRRYELGTRSALELRLAITNAATADADLAVRRRLLDAAGRQLELLLSRYPAGRPDAGGGGLPEPAAAVPAGLPAELVTRRPDLVALELRIAAAGFDVRAARAALYPRLTLTGSAGRLSDEVEDLLDDDFSVWSLAAGLMQPVLQGGRLRAGIGLAEARYRELAESYAQAALRAFGEVELALAAAASLERQAAALREAVEQAVAAQELSEDRYQAGLVDYLAVLEARREANLAQIRLLAVRRQQLDARVDLHLALGGGFDSGAAAPSAHPTPLPTGSR